MAHTPGPWWNTGLELQSKPYPGIEIWGWPDCEQEYQVFIALVLDTQASIPLEQTQANAHLIAVAPEMLAELESMRDDLALLVGEGHIEAYNFQRVDALIAKARGA